MARKLHIGGHEKKEGWEIADLNASEIVDHVCDASDMTCFQENTFDEVYASHVLEHFDYLQTSKVLSEWNRILKLNGILYISVPDLKKMGFILLQKLNLEEQYYVSRVIYGGHVNKLDYHVAGFTEDIMNFRLSEAKFTNITFLENLPQLFNDSSRIEIKGIPISLNVKASKLNSRPI